MGKADLRSDQIFEIHACDLCCPNSVVKNPVANAGDPREAGSIPGSGRYPGEGNGNPLQYSYLGNPIDRGTWRLQSMGSKRVGHDRVTEHTQTHSPVY